MLQAMSSVRGVLLVDSSAISAEKQSQQHVYRIQRWCLIATRPGATSLFKKLCCDKQQQQQQLPIKCIYLTNAATICSSDLESGT